MKGCMIFQVPLGKYLLVSWSQWKLSSQWKVNIIHIFSCMKVSLEKEKLKSSDTYATDQRNISINWTSLWLRVGILRPNLYYRSSLHINMVGLRRTWIYVFFSHWSHKNSRISIPDEKMGNLIGVVKSKHSIMVYLERRFIIYYWIIKC